MRKIAIALMLFVLSACVNIDNITAPAEEEQEISISLPPFPAPAVSVWAGDQVGQQITFYAPVGVLPELELTTSGVGVLSRSVELSQLPTIENESRAGWMAYVVIRTTGEIGEATVRLSLKRNPKVFSAFRLYMVIPGGKG